MPIKTRFPFNTSRNLMTAIALKFSSIVCPSLCHQLLLVVQVLEHVRTLRPRLYRTAATKTVKEKCIAWWRHPPYYLPWSMCLLSFFVLLYFVSPPFCELVVLLDTASLFYLVFPIGFFLFFYIDAHHHPLVSTSLFFFLDKIINKCGRRYRRHAEWWHTMYTHVTHRNCKVEADRSGRTTFQTLPLMKRRKNREAKKFVTELFLFCSSILLSVWSSFSFQCMHPSKTIDDWCILPSALISFPLFLYLNT